MTNISTKINSNIGKGLGYTVKKWFSKTLEAGRNNPEKYAGAMMVTSIVSKDLVGGYYYTTQSLNNEKIPEEKRKFVASLDLMNGILMVGGQILIYSVVEKIASKALFKNFIGKKLDGDMLKQHAKKIVKASTENLNLQEVYEELVKTHGSGSKQFKALETGFGLIVGFLATTALTKRLIVPFLSTPLAGWFKNKYMDKKPQKPKQDVKPEVKPNSDDLLLSHEVAPWNYSNKDGDRLTLNKIR